MRTIYFDYNATTPLDPTVREAMLPFLDDVWGNPSSVHHVGRRARVLLDDARDRAGRVLGCKPGEIIFTSGGTESNALAIFGTARLLKPKGCHIITSAIEHQAVLASCEYLAKQEGFQLTILPVDREGFVSPDALKQAICNDTVLVSVMAANNEIGTIQPIADLGTLCRERGVIFHTDAIQWFGKEPFKNIQQFHADLVSLCGHKFHGPKGAGLLFARSPLRPDPILFGGGHENERRAGTENLAAIAGLVRAMERFVAEPVFKRSQLDPLTHRLRGILDALPGVQMLGSRSKCLPNTVSFVVEGADGITLLAGLDLEGVCASSGAACSAGSLEPSHVVKALGYSEDMSKSLVRFSLGRDSTMEEVQFVGTVLPKLLSHLRSHK
jgi:cysteine desulfurase